MHKTLTTLGVSVISLYNQEGAVLLASRPVGKEKEGYWELPGGKLEFAESPLHCIQRECSEELGLKLLSHEVRYLTQYPYAYEDKVVLLFHFTALLHRAMRIHPREGQHIDWVMPANLASYHLLPATRQLLF